MENHTPIAIAGIMTLSLRPGILGPSARASGSLLLFSRAAAEFFEVIESSSLARSGVLSLFSMTISVVLGAGSSLETERDCGDVSVFRELKPC